jgi:hypothetical protein
MLQNACKMSEILSNNCLAKNSVSIYAIVQAISSKMPVRIIVKQLFYKKDVFLVVQAICFKMPVKSFKHLFGKKSAFPQFIMQAMCFKMPVKGLNAVQRIVCKKKRISPC